MIGYNPQQQSLGSSNNGGSSNPDNAGNNSPVRGAGQTTKSAAAPKNSKKVTFSLPPGVDPGGSGVGDCFEVVALLCVKSLGDDGGDGGGGSGGNVSVYIEKINGIPMENGDEEAQPDNSPGFQDSVESGIPNQ